MDCFFVLTTSEIRETIRIARFLKTNWEGWEDWEGFSSLRMRDFRIRFPLASRAHAHIRVEKCSQSSQPSQIQRNQLVRFS